MKISIITVNLNNDTGLQCTINSILEQNYDNFEYIVIDGGSKDQSVEIIKRHSQKIAYWISQPDKGIYDAMNKGILKATGDYCLFLNSGDYLDNSFVIKNFVELNYNEDIIFGRITNLRLNGVKIQVEYPDEEYITFKHFLNSTLPHPSTFIKRSLFDKVGVYNIQLDIVADWEFFLKALFMYNATLRKINLNVAVFNLNGLSCSKLGQIKMLEERTSVLNRNFKRFLTDYKSFDKIQSSVPFKIYNFMRKIKNTVRLYA